MVSKATDFEAHKSLYPPILQPKLHSATTWGCATASGATVTHTQHCVECNTFPHPITPHQSCNLSYSKPTEEGHRLSHHMTVSHLLLRQFWGGILFHLATNTWQMFSARRETRLQKYCLQHGLAGIAALLLSGSPTVPHWHPLPLEN